jgi:hypothetical protein
MSTCGDYCHHWLIIEFSYLDAPIATFVAQQIGTIAEGLLGPRGVTWTIQPARNDMTVVFARLGDLHCFRDRLVDLGWIGLVEDSEYVYGKEIVDEDEDEDTV